jgi:hypothetical protein
MVRTLILGLLLLAAAHVRAADEAELNMPAAAASSPASASAPATPPAADATKHGAKQQSASRKPDAGKVQAQTTASEAAPSSGDVKMSGMSILGNEDAPKSLVIVPWKSSQLADMPSVSRLLDSATQPVDKEVFMRELSYYEFKSGSK